jgi:hypothetical protein
VSKKAIIEVFGAELSRGQLERLPRGDLLVEGRLGLNRAAPSGVRYSVAFKPEVSCRVL